MDHFTFLCKLANLSGGTEFAGLMTDIVFHYRQHGYLTPLQIDFVLELSHSYSLIPPSDLPSAPRETNLDRQSIYHPAKPFKS